MLRQPEKEENFEDAIENNMDALDSLQNVSVPNSASEFRRNVLCGKLVADSSSVGTFSLSSPINENRNQEKNHYNHSSKYSILSKIDKQINL